MSALPMGCQRCGIVRRDHDTPGHRWISPDMRTVLARAAVLKNRRTA